MTDHDKDGFREFVAIVKALRTPETGCPWDLEQDHRSLRRYLLEETYEVLDAIDRGRDDDLCEELGDLMLQIVLHAQIAADRSAFTISEVLRGIIDKMVRRHPHVFGSTQVADAAEVLRNWETIKASEKPRPTNDELLALPALLRAQRRAKKSPLPDERELFARLGRGLETMREKPTEAVLGQILFDVCRLAERSQCNAEDALRAALAEEQAPQT